MATKAKPRFTLDEISDHQIGLCLACGEQSHDDCEPDMRNGHCDACGENRVFGLEEALVMGEIELADDDMDDDGGDL